MESYKDLVRDLRHPTRELRDAIPETWGGFADMHQAAVADGVLPAKVKEMIALAIAVAEGCDGCIGYHAAGAARRGASHDEVAEALGVALLMRGGPASVYAPKAMQAFEEWAGPREERESA